MQRILVAVDGSDHAWKALDLGFDLGEKHGAAVVVLHVVTDHPLTDGERRLAETEYLGNVVEGLDLEGLMEARGDSRVFARELLKRHGEVGLRLRQAVGQRQLDEASSRAHARAFAALETLMEAGKPAATILRVAGEQAVDMIVLGSRGLGDLEGALLGSVSHRVAHAAPCTCVTVT